MRDIGIRQGRPEDVAAITTLTRQAYAKWIPLIGREPLPMLANYAEAITRHRFDLLFVGSDLAALIETELRPEDLFIENVAVAPGFQKRGFGRRLLAHAEALALEARRNRIRLFTNGRFLANLNLYTALGYEVEREEPFRSGVAVHFVKKVGR